MHDEKKPGDVLKVPGDSLDNVADDVRYGIYTWITANEMPREVKRAELGRQFAPLLLDQTLSEAERKAVATSLMIWHSNLDAQENVRTSPPRIGRFGGRFMRWRKESNCAWKKLVNAGSKLSYSAECRVDQKPAPAKVLWTAEELARDGVVHSYAQTTAWASTSYLWP